MILNKRKAYLIWISNITIKYLYAHSKESKSTCNSKAPILFLFPDDDHRISMATLESVDYHCDCELGEASSPVLLLSFIYKMVAYNGELSNKQKGNK